MKKIFFSIAVTAIAVVAANAQNNLGGIYLNYNQLENNKPAYINDRNTKIRLNEFLGDYHITVIENGEKQKLLKSDVYAYQAPKGVVMLCWNDGQYLLPEKGIIWIYSRDMTIFPGKETRREKRHFYSVSGRDEILRLTILNFKKYFPGKHVFHNFLDAQFRSDSELPLYDDYENKFKVNHILETTLFEK